MKRDGPRHRAGPSAHERQVHQGPELLLNREVPLGREVLVGRDVPPGRTVLVGLRGLLGVALCGCHLAHRPDTPAVPWQDPSPPRLSLSQKAERYQQDLEARFLSPEGVVRYELRLDHPGEAFYGDRSDGPFHTGMYLASQALRWHVTREPGARAQALLALRGLGILHDVTGSRGLFARFVTPLGTVPLDAPSRGRWRPSRPHPELEWKGDVSKDQYAGIAAGLGVALWAFADDTEVLAQVARLAGAIADHLGEHDLSLVDVTGAQTTYGDLSPYVFGFPVGVNALIALSLARTASIATGEARHLALYRRVGLKEGGIRAAYWFHVSFALKPSRVNDNMAYLSLLPLLLLEDDPALLGRFAGGEARAWQTFSREHNAFFAGVHVLARARSGDGARRDVHEARVAAREALLEYPDRKVEGPVDLTREGFDFPRRWLPDKHGFPRSRTALPLYLRARSSSYWVSDPYRLVADLEKTGNRELSGEDYLLAYWLARAQGILSEPREPLQPREPNEPGEPQGRAPSRPR